MSLESDPTTGAIYYQRSKAVQEEFKLIELTTERELVVSQLEAIIRDVKESRKELDDDTLLDSFTLFNKVREVTIQLLKAIAAWQMSFTRPIRPNLLQCDYMVEKVVKHIDFINASKIRKIFNFQFLRGNALLLPFPNLRNDTPIKVGQALGKEIKKFSNPIEADVVAAYQVLLNSLPDEVYKEQLVSIEKWLLGPWVPRIWISNSNKKYFTIAKPSTPGNTSGAQSANGMEDGGGAPKVRTKRGAAMADFAGGGVTSSTNISSAQDAPLKSDRRRASKLYKRRNQMLSKEAENILTLTDADGGGGEEAKGAVAAPLSMEEQEELQQLELYYKELESMFLPKLGRRAVQTIVVGGRRMSSAVRSSRRRTSLFLANTTQGDMKSAEEALKSTNTNAFVRTNAQLIAKRDRILQDRGEGEVAYQSHSTSVPPPPSTTPPPPTSPFQSPDSSLRKGLRKGIEKTPQPKDRILQDRGEGEMTHANNSASVPPPPSTTPPPLTSPFHSPNTSLRKGIRKGIEKAPQPKEVPNTSISLAAPVPELPPLSLEEGSNQGSDSPAASIEAPSRSRRNSAVSFSEHLPVLIQQRPLTAKGTAATPKNPKSGGKGAVGGEKIGTQASTTPPTSAGSKKRGGKASNSTPVRPGSPLSLSTNGLREWFMTQGKDGK